MKILMVSESPLYKVDGQFYAIDTWVRFPLYLATQADLTLAVPVVEYSPGTPPPKDSWRVELGNATLAPLDPYSSYASYFRMWPLRRAAWRAAFDRLVREHDIVLHRIQSPTVGLVAQAAARHRRMLVHLVTGDIEAQSDRILDARGMKRVVLRGIVRALVRQEVRAGRRATLVYAYSGELAARHGGFGERVRPMRTPHLRERDIHERPQAEIGRPIRLLRVSWLIPSKGIAHLIEAVAILARRGVDTRLEIVGKDRAEGHKGELERLVRSLGVAERVTFTGWVPFDRISDVYQRNDIHVISSLSEGTPRCIVEGAANGIPLVATAVGGCIDVLRDGENAMVVPPGDPDRIAAAIEQLAGDVGLRGRLVANGYRDVRAATFEQLGNRFLSEIREELALASRDGRVAREPATSVTGPQAD